MSTGNVNKIILVGHLGRDPELQFTEKGNALLKISLATTKEFLNAAGDKVKETSWHRATLWGKRAEACAKYLTKGSRVYLEGELRMQTYQDKDGQNRKSADINVEQIVFLGGGQRSATKPAVEESTAMANAQ